MVSRNNRIERMEQAAERQSHFGIRKLTIGAASVLLGTTLWLGTNANVTHAESNDASSNSDADQAQESNNATPSIGKNTQVTVVTNKSDIDKTDVAANQSNSETSSDLQSKVDVKSQDDANKAASVKANINAATDAAKVTESVDNSGKAVSSSNLNNGRSTSAQVKSNNASGQNAVQTTKQGASSNAASVKTGQDEQSKTIAAAQNANAVQKAASDTVKTQISDAAQAGKVNASDAGAKSDKLDLSKLDVSTGELGAQLATDHSLNNISNKLMNAAVNGKSASNQVNANADLTNNSALNANVKGASLISGADSGENSGNGAGQTPKKVIVEATNTGNLTDNRANAIDENVGVQGRTEAFDLSKFVLMPSLAPKADSNALSKLFGPSLAENDSHKATANSWDELQTAINNSAINDVTISGNINANGDLNIDRALTIEGADKNAALTLGTNAINNNSELTLKDITIDGSILGKGTVNVEGTVTSNVDNSNQRTLSASQLNEQVGINHPGATVSNWKAANVEASQVNVDNQATLNINRSINGDGIDLGQTGSVNVGVDGNLNITLKDGTENYESLRSTEKNANIENANTAIRALNSGTFTTEDGSTINLNVGHGRGIVFNEPFGGNAAIQVPDQTAFYRARYDAGLQNQGGASTVSLGPNTTLNLSGRDGFVLGNHAKFTTGDFSNITFHNGGNGVGLQMDAQAVVEISPHSTMIMLSNGKNHSGVYNALNYIGLGENAQFTVDHDAAFIYKLTNAWTNGSLNYADNFNIVSVKSDSNPTINIKDNAIFDGESDYRNIFGELLSFSYNGAPVKSTVNIDGARYVNFLRHGATTPGGWQNVVANDPQGKHSGNLFYSWPANTWNVNGNTYNVYKWTDETDSQDTFDGTTYDKLVQSIKDLNNSSSEYWKDVKNLTLGVNMHRSNLTDQTPNTQTGVKNGWQSDDKNGHGFDTEFSQRLALVATKIPTEEVLQNSQSEGYNTQIVYDQNLKPGEIELFQKGVKGITRTTKIAYYTVDLSDPNNPTRVLDTSKGDKGYKTTTSVLVQGKDEIIHVGPQTATINYLEKDGNNAPVAIKDASGNAIVGTATDTPIATDTNGSIEFDDQGNTTPQKIKYNDGKVLSSDSADLQRAEEAAGSDYKYDVNRDDWSQAVKLGTNVYDNQGLTRPAIVVAAEKLQEGQTVQLGVTQGPTYNVVLFKSEHVAQSVEQVSITQKIQRAISYKNNKDRQNISDPNGADRNTAAGLDDMSKSLLHGEAKDEQSITLKGIAYLDTSTGKFVNVKTQNGHPVDADGNYIAIDDNGNAVIGDLQSDGTVKARLTNGQPTLTNYVIDGDRQGTFKWSLDTSDAAGFASPTADHYDVNPGSVPALDGSIKTTATFVKDAQGNTINNPTLQQVVDYLNNESAQDALQQAVSQDVISDATDYPQMPQVPSTQYIFDQFRLSNTSGNTDWNYVVTLATDRDDPTGAVHVYVTSPDYTQTYMSRTAVVNNYNDPAWYSNVINGDRFTIRVNNWGGQNGDSVSVNVNNGFTLKRIFGYGAQSTDASASWGDYKPRQVTQTINYIDEKTGKPIQGYPSVTVKGLIGQHFDANGVNHLNIPGYTFDQANSDTPSGTISDYQVGQTYSRTWYAVDGTRITEHHTLVNANGTMNSVVYVGNRRYTGTIAPNSYMTAGNYQIQNPWVKPTTTVNLRYTENPVTIDQNQTPYYVVYTPNAKGTVNVIFHDTTTNTDITGYGPKTPLSGDEGTDVTGYTPDADITTLEGLGYIRDTTTPIPTGDLSDMPAKYTDGNQTVYINMKHKVTPVTPDTPTPNVPSNTPNWARPDQLKKTVKRTVTYSNNDGTTFTGTVPNNAVETLEFDGKAYIDVVNGHVVTVKSDTPDAQGNYEIDNDANNEANITWTAKDGTSFSAVTSPTETNYHVASVSDHADGTNVAAIDNITKDSQDINIQVKYDKNAAEAAHLKIVDDTTGQTLNDSISAEGDENTPISFTNGQSTVDGYLQNGYRFVSVVNDASANNPLSTTSYEDGAAKFGNYDTDPNTDQRFTVHLAHQVVDINKDNPHGYPVTASVTRKVNYTVDGVADSTLPSHTETANFSATGHYDLVEHKVVDLVNGQEKVTNGKVDDGHLTWTVDGGTTDSSTLTGYAVPIKAGYHVNNVTADPAADKDANVDDTGLVKDLSVNHESHDVTITINLTKNPIADVQDVVNYIDDTTNKTVRTDTGSALKSLTGKPNDNVTYTTADIIKGYTDQGYRLVSNDFNDGHETFGNTGKTYNVHLVHKIDTIDQHNPHGQTITATVTRQVNYTVDGVADSSLPSHTETANFNATGYYDEVTHKVVDLVEHTTADQGKVKLDQNGNETDGHLTWTVAGGTQDSSTLKGYAVPTKEGYHVNNVTVAPVADKDANVEDSGLVKDLTVDHNSHNVTININLTKNTPATTVADIVNYIDDTTGQTLRTDNGATLDTLKGKANTKVNYTTAGIIKGYTDQGYRLVSNDFHDGQENFGSSARVYNVHLAHQVVDVDKNNPRGYTVTATVTRQVNYTVDGVSDSSLPSHTETANFSATGHYDLVEHKLVDMVNGQEKVTNGRVDDGQLTWKTDGGSQDSSTFTGYAVPTKAGYHVNRVTVDPAADKNANVDDTGLVHDLTVDHDSHNVTITINLTKNAPAANVADIVNYIDDTTAQTLKTDNGNVISTLAGKPNGKVTYTTADIIKDYESQGYRLVSNDFNDGHEVFGNDGRTYNVHLAHKVATFTGDNPYGINAKATVTRQVNYTVDGVPDSTLPDHTETANFSASGHYDLVEHKVVDMVNGQEKVTNGKVDDGHLTWTVDGGSQDSSTLKGYAVPTKAGYHVNSVTVDPAADKNANADNTGLVHDLTVNHDGHDVTVTINLTKNGQTVKNQRTIDTKATVHYVIDGTDADKPAAPADDVQDDFQFSYSGDIYDAVTGDLISRGQWTTGTTHAYHEVNSPAISGYHTDTAVVPSSQLTVTTDQPTVEVTVHYIKNGQETRNKQDLDTSATVHYVIDGDDADKPAAPADNVQNGFTFSYSGDIYDKFTGQLIHQGSWNAESHAYKAVTSPAVDGYHTEITVVPASELTVDRFNRHIEVTVHYVKNGQTIRNEHDINTKATVHYVIDGDDANKPAAPTDYVQNNFQFHYSGDIYDAQTGKLISNGQWNATTHAYDAVTSPVINGYHAVVTVVPASQLTVTQDKPDVLVTVHYVKNGTTIRNQRSVSASQKVEYQDDQGNTLSPEKDQNFTFNYSGDTYDAVTGDLISRGQWSVASHNFTGENVPVINGYVAVSGYTKSGNSYTAGGFDTIPTASEAERNRTFIVVYKKTSNIVPVDPNHNPIPNVPTPQYPNDPKNPTNVTPNEPVPTIPGYTPEVPTVTPTDPTKSTEVVYDRDQMAQVVYRDVNDPQNIITLDTDGDLTGKAGEAVQDSQVPTKISNFEEKGYVLVTNGFINAIFDNVAGNTQTFYVDFKHQTTTVTPDKPGHPGQPVNPDNPNGPKYPTGTDLNQVKRTGTQTIHYQGAGDKTPADNKQSFDFTRTITFDDVTGKIITTTPWNVSSHTFGNVDTPVVPGYHADRRTAGGTTITPDDLTKRVIVTYSPNGKIVPVDPKGNPIPNAPTPQYPTNPKDPTNVTPNEPVPTVPGYTPTQPSVTPTDPGKDTPVIYVKDQVAQVIYRDINDPSHVITLDTDKDLTGKAGDAIKDDQVQTKITNFENAGYVLANNGFTNAIFDDVAGDTQTFYVDFKHKTITINPNNPGKPGTPINPNDPNGPKWGNDTDKDHLQVHGSQTVHYTGAGDQTPGDKVQNIDFNHEVVIDKVTGKQIEDHGWKVVDPKTGKVIADGDSHQFGKETTPVVNGYVANKKDGGGLTATVKNPNVTDDVTYKAIGKIIPVDPKGNPIPGAEQPKYHNDPSDPTKVVPNEPVPTVPGWTPTKNSVTPTDPTEDTPVVYNKTPQPDIPTPPAGPGTNPAPTPTQPQPSTPQTSNVTPHPEPTPTLAPSTPTSNVTPAPAPAPHPEPATPKPKPQGVPTPQVHTVTPHPEQTKTVMPNGQVVDHQGQVTGYVDQTGTVHSTLPQTGESSKNNVATILAGGAAVAISLIGLAGVRKRRD